MYLEKLLKIAKKCKCANRFTVCGTNSTLDFLENLLLKTWHLFLYRNSVLALFTSPWFSAQLDFQFIFIVNYNFDL